MYSNVNDISTCSSHETVKLDHMKARNQNKATKITVSLFNLCSSSHNTHTHTHTQPFYCSSGICPGPPGWAGTRKVKAGKLKPIWIYWSKRQWVTVASAGLYASLHLIPDNHANILPLSFLQAGCPSCRPTNDVKALKAHKLRHIHIFKRSCSGGIKALQDWLRCRNQWQYQTVKTGRSLQVTISARQINLVSGHSLYAMHDHSRFSKLADETLQMSKWKMVEIGRYVDVGLIM